VRAGEGRVIWSEKEICGGGGRRRRRRKRRRRKRKSWSGREIEIGVVMVR